MQVWSPATCDLIEDLENFKEECESHYIDHNGNKVFADPQCGWDGLEL